MRFFSFFRGALLACAMQLPLSVCNAQVDYGLLPDNRQLSIGVSAGISDLWGDVGTTYFWNHYRSPYYWENLHFMGSVHLKYSLNAWLATRLSVGYGTIYASDQFNKFLADKEPSADKLPYQLYIRNQDITTNITEGSLVFEINPFRAFDVSRQVARMRIQPTLLLGVGYFHFDPYGTYTSPNGSKRSVRLHDLHTEGQGLRGSGNSDGMYGLNQFNLPIGGGLRYQISDQLAVSLEYQYRLCFTDYLDDVSGSYIDPAVFDQNMVPYDATIAKSMHNKTPLVAPDNLHPAGDIRGTPKEKDGYSTFGFTLFYTFLNNDYVHSYHRNGRRRTLGERLW